MSLHNISKYDLDTPALALDIDVFEHNLKTMRDFALSVGKQLRPHAKTHKCSEIVRRQIAAGNCVGVCVAKVSEAAALVDAGIKDILITSPVVTATKISRLFACAAEAPGLIVVVDNFDNAKQLNDEAVERGIKLKVLVDLDPEMGRTGIAYDKGLGLGKFVVEQPGLELKGIQCYAGTVQHIESFEERRNESQRRMRLAAEVFHQFKDAGLNCEIFTGTGTGTFNIDCDIPEMTDFQVGSYCVMDAEYTNIGSQDNPDKFDTFKPALTVLSSVVSVNRDDFVTVDAGLKTIYFTPHAPPQVIYPNQGGKWSYAWFGDEQGRIYFPSPELKPALGSVVELSASHCDPTINLFNSIYVTRGDKVIDCWDIDLRGKSQ